MKRTALSILIAAMLAVECRANASPSLSTVLMFNGSNGATPQSPLISDGAGNLYGTTTSGGLYGWGNVFELSGPNHQTFTSLMDYTDSSRGLPRSIVMDSAGNLVGTTAVGSGGAGTIFELSGADHKTFSNLVTFNTTNGLGPTSLTMDGSGNIYGVTYSGGTGLAAGTVFELTGANHQTVNTLYSFQHGADGSQPNVLISDAAGNLYGTTYGGSYGDGSVFMISGANHQTFTPLATLNGNTNTGRVPVGLALGKDGNLYGTASDGGGATGIGNGTIFELSGADHKTFTPIFTFHFASDSGTPDSSVLIDAAGNLFGTTYDGVGTVYELSGSDHATHTTLWTFSGGLDGAFPTGGLLSDDAGNLYGVTEAEGGVPNPSESGTVFEITNSGFAVPEPTGLAVMAVTGLFLLRRRHRWA